MMNKAYIALGSNIPPRFNYLKQAIEAIHELDQVSVINQSAIYETEPVGYKDQNKFLNQVIEVNTSQTALELLELCQSIEDRLGRKRNVRWDLGQLILIFCFMSRRSLKWINYLFHTHE